MPFDVTEIKVMTVVFITHWQLDCDLLRSKLVILSCTFAS